MKTRQGAKQVQDAASGGSGNLLRHDGHVLSDGSKGLPHYQSNGSYGHTFWGNMRGGADPELLGWLSLGLGLLIHSGGTGGCDENGICSDMMYTDTNTCTK